MPNPQDIPTEVSTPADVGSWPAVAQETWTDEPDAGGTSASQVNFTPGYETEYEFDPRMAGEQMYEDEFDPRIADEQMYADEFDHLHARDLLYRDQLNYFPPAQDMYRHRFDYPRIRDLMFRRPDLDFYRESRAGMQLFRGETQLDRATGGLDNAIDALQNGDDQGARRYLINSLRQMNGGIYDLRIGLYSNPNNSWGDLRGERTVRGGLHDVFDSRRDLKQALRLLESGNADIALEELIDGRRDLRQGRLQIGRGVQSIMSSDDYTLFDYGYNRYGPYDRYSHPGEWSHPIGRPPLDFRPRMWEPVHLPGCVNYQYELPFDGPPASGYPSEVVPHTGPEAMEEISVDPTVPSNAPQEMYINPTRPQDLPGEEIFVDPTPPVEEVPIDPTIQSEPESQDVPVDPTIPSEPESQDGPVDPAIPSESQDVPVDPTVQPAMEEVPVGPSLQPMIDELISSDSTPPQPASADVVPGDSTLPPGEEVPSDDLELR